MGAQGSEFDELRCFRFGEAAGLRGIPGRSGAESSETSDPGGFGRIQIEAGRSGGGGRS